MIEFEWENPKLTILMRFPSAFEGKFFRNFARTAPLLPCGRVTLPQMTLKWFGFFSLRPAIAVLLNKINEGHLLIQKNFLWKKALILLFGTVDKSASFTQIEVRLLLVLDALDFKQSSVLFLCTVIATVSSEHCFGVQTFLRFGFYHLGLSFFFLEWSKKLALLKKF